MKRVLSWLCLIIALAALPKTAHAASTPGDLYLSYKIDGGSWHFGNKMTKSGTTWTYTLPETTSSNVEFAINTVKASNENGLKQGSTQYCRGDNSVGTAEVDATTTLYLYGSTDHWLKYNKAGKHTFTLKTTSGESSGYVNLQLDITTECGGSSDPDFRDQVNLPIKRSEFGSKPRYFLVGTRMGDWRLQPEWELKDLGNGKVGINTPRIMYTGRIAVAKVDNWDDYSVSKYTLYAYNQWGFSTNITSANIYNKGSFSYYDNNAYVAADKCDKFCAATDIKWGEDAVRYNKGALVNKIEVTLNNNKPSKLDFTFSANPFADVNKYLTFSLVGSNLINEGMPDAKNTHKGMDSWQCAWVQYDPQTGMPYRDARKQLYYQTVFQSDWLDSHPTVFNKKLSSRDFNYTSNEIVMRNAKSFTDEELADDAYAEYYKRFEGSSDKTLGKDASGDHPVKVGDKYQFYEYMKFHNGSGGVDYKGTAADWECYVVKDMWMDGTFKVWTGWGGGLKSKEIDTTNNDDPRWYYVNGGHAHEHCKGNDENAVVRGFDISRKDEHVAVYGTATDVNEADFKINNLTYFKRVIVWYDPARGFDNSVIQLIIERFGPAIKAMRGTYGNEIDYTWNIPEDPDNRYSTEEKKTRITRYTITRYHLADDNVTMVSDGVIKDVSPENLTVGDMLEGVPVTDSGLNAGTYQYRVDVWTTDGGGDNGRRFAMSNRVTLVEASQPVNAKAYQRTETAADGSTLYSFDVVLDLDLKKGEVGDGTNTYEYKDLVSDYLIEIPDGIAATMNSALRVYVDGVALDPGQSWFQSKSLDVYVDGNLTPTSKQGYWLEVPVDGAKTTKIIFENLVGATPQQVYSFDVYLRPKEDLKTVYANANFQHSDPKTPLTIPGVEVKFVAGGVKPYTDNKPEEMLFGKKTPAKAMPMGSHDRKQSDINAAENFQVVAPIHYTEANQLYAEFAVSEPAVTRSVRDNFAIRYKGASVQTDRDNLPELCASTAAAEVTAEEAFAGITRRECIDVTNLAQEATGIDADGNTYLTIATGAVVPVLAIADVEYRHEGNANAIRPLECSRAESNLSLALPVPQVEPQVRLTTNEQDATNNDKKRYYVHELYANLGLTNITDVKANYTVRPGFHLVPATAHNVTFSGSDCKAARGGVIAHEGLFGFTNDFFQSTYLEGYTPFNGIYDQTSDNWARLSANKGNIPVYVNYFWVQDKEATGENYRTGIPNLSGYVAYHYPFVVADNSGIAALAADDEHNMVTLTSVSPLNKAFMADEVMTAIGNVTADADWADAEFYNLQGIRVMNPVPGQVYLVRRGADVTKVLYR